MGAIRSDGDDVLVDVKVVPGASRTRLAGAMGERVKIAVAAAPERGKANKGLVDFLAKLCAVQRRQVLIERGEHSPVKTLRIRRATVDRVRRALELPSAEPENS